MAVVQTSIDCEWLEEFGASYAPSSSAALSSPCCAHTVRSLQSPRPERLHRQFRCRHASVSASTSASSSVCRSRGHRLPLRPLPRLQLLPAPRLRSPLRFRRSHSRRRSRPLRLRPLCRRFRDVALFALFKVAEVVAHRHADLLQRLFADAGNLFQLLGRHVGQSLRPW